MSIKHRYSGIETAYRCQRKFQLQYLDKVPQEGPESIHLHFGTAMHSAIQAALEGDSALDVFQIHWESVVSKFPHEKYEYGRLLKTGPELLRKFTRLHLKKFKPAHLEQALSGTIAGVEFEGTVDYLGDYEGVPSVVDWKTSAYAYGKEKIQINPQMPLYAEMARLKLGYEAKQVVYYVFVKSSESIQVQVAELTPELRQRSLDTCLGMARRLEAAEEYPQNFTACVMGKALCPYFNKCFGGNDAS